MKVLGLDIGGANIKASSADGETASVAFPMWKQHTQLPAALAAIAADHFDSPDLVAVTMTGELADCFATKAEGVAFIVNAVVEAFPQAAVRVWLTSGEFCEPDDACELPTLVAAANWHALATWAGRAVPQGPAILIDVGSTTTDIIPLMDGRPISRGLNDCERLLAGELVYTGVRRTPVCAISPAVTFRDQSCPVAAELFATTADVYVLTGDIAEDDGDTDTADGRPLTRHAAQLRLAHMLCCDLTEIDPDELDAIARELAEHQLCRICSAVEQVLSALKTDAQLPEQTRPTILISGSGTFLAERVVDRMADQFDQRVTMANMFRHPIATSACAFAVARLGHDLCRDDFLEMTTL